MTTTLVAVSVLGDWVEENYSTSAAQWVREGMKTLPSDEKIHAFFKAVRDGGMLPLLVDALEEASTPLPTIPSPNRPGYITVCTPGYSVVRRGDGLKVQWLRPFSPYRKDSIVKGPFKSFSHAHIWLLVLKHQS